MDFHDKLRKIEALFAGAQTDGERQAADLARKRILERLHQDTSSRIIEYTISLRDEWNKRLFVAICNKHKIKTYRYKRQKYTTTMVRVTPNLMDELIWPEYKRYSASLNEFISNLTNDLIEKIHKVEEDVIVSEGLLLE